MSHDKKYLRQASNADLGKMPGEDKDIKKEKYRREKRRNKKNHA